MADTNYVAQERLYLDAGGKVVKADDPTRHSLLVGVGGTLPKSRAEQLGLLDQPEPEPAPEPEAKAVPAPPANKAVGGPSESKGK